MDALFGAWVGTRVENTRGHLAFLYCCNATAYGGLIAGERPGLPALRSRALENIRGDVMGMLSDGLLYYFLTQTIDG